LATVLDETVQTKGSRIDVLYSQGIITFVFLCDINSIYPTRSQSFNRFHKVMK